MPPPSRGRLSYKSPLSRFILYFKHPDKLKFEPIKKTGCHNCDSLFFTYLFFDFFDLLKMINVTTIITGKAVAKTNPVLRLPSTISEMLPTIAGLTIAPRSPARARNANIAVPPRGQFSDDTLMEPGHMIPTARPQSAHPQSPVMGKAQREARR